MTNGPSGELVVTFFRMPDPQDWSPRIQKGWEACRRLLDVLTNYQVVQHGFGYMPTRDSTPHMWSMPAETVGLILAAGLCFWKPVFQQARQRYHCTWILHDGRLDISELKEHLDWAEREAVRAWEEREQATAGRSPR